MEYRLRPISKGGVPAAIAKAEVYRYLNEPEEAESICRDVLAVDPHHQLARRLLGLTITDQFTGGGSDRCAEVEEIFQSLTNPYERLYYTGLFHERRAKAQLRAGSLPHTLLVLFEKAMHCFAEAEKIRPADNDDTILRWNRCVRLLQSRTGSEWEQEFAFHEAHDSPPT
jgi:hypothetical protein